MRDWTKIRERYLRDALPIRLGGLATNLGRIRSFAAHEASRETVAGLIEESKFFIEWSVPDAEIEVAADLVELQVELARWQYKWKEIWGNLVQRGSIADRSKNWSDRVLAMSGLLSD